MTQPVTDRQIIEHLPMIERNAMSLRGVAGADYDDLRQEGMISVWIALSKGIVPSAQVVRGRMLNWIRFLRRECAEPYAMGWDEVQ